MPQASPYVQAREETRVFKSKRSDRIAPDCGDATSDGDRSVAT